MTQHSKGAFHGAQNASLGTRTGPFLAQYTTRQTVINRQIKMYGHTVGRLQHLKQTTISRHEKNVRTYNINICNRQTIIYT
jgi:hypothetical protein